ncbi:twin-arginine translocase subunit TatC [Clostridium frigoris]|uniref:Sec-independent protein translocase protein TatC n=1 Tax=Clostridium frigoris TaxID=205327 RepID=A0ABS6BV40_9CLOT|nr:twin-arginine translocase subunit TatC [Clostridium frigoris]MBU3159717.1 twin-arginine translocase subunit TatC [Clostridium frigoris]
MIKSEVIVQAAHWFRKSRKIIIWIIIIIIAAASLVYLKSSLLINVLAKPLNGIQLHFMTPSEGLMAKVSVSFLGGLVIASPVILLLVMKAIGSILTKKIKRLLVFVIIPLSFSLFVFGMYFGYTLVLPTTIKFLMDTSDGFMQPILSASEYFSFIGLLLFCIGVIFELPLILIALSRIGIINSKMLKKARKMTILISFIVAALITPSSDAFTLIVVTMPIVVLYEISVLSIFLLEKNDKRKKKKNLKKFKEL